MHWQRQFLHPMLLAFDAPTREECTAMRPRSNTPQAALVLLNDPSFVEAARRLAARVLRDLSSASPSPSSSAETTALDTMWERVVSRKPTTAEADYCLRLLQNQREIYKQDAAAAEKLLSVGLSDKGCDSPAPELAAWTTVARALLALSETNTRN